MPIWRRTGEDLDLEASSRSSARSEVFHLNVNKQTKSNFVLMNPCKFWHHFRAYLIFSANKMQEKKNISKLITVGCRTTKKLVLGLHQRSRCHGFLHFSHPFNTKLWGSSTFTKMHLWHFRAAWARLCGAGRGVGVMRETKQTNKARISRTTVTSAAKCQKNEVHWFWQWFWITMLPPAVPLGNCTP